MSTDIQIKSRNPVCGLIKEELEERNLTQEKVAQDLSVSKAYINQLINYKKDLSHELALRLEVYLGIEASYLLKIQTQWKLRQHKKALASELKAIPVAY